MVHTGGYNPRDNCEKLPQARGGSFEVGFKKTPEKFDGIPSSAALLGKGTWHANLVGSVALIHVQEQCGDAARASQEQCQVTDTQACPGLLGNISAAKSPTDQ